MPPMTQPDLFTLEHTPAAARGPVQSQLTLASLGRDESLKANIARAVLACSTRRYSKWSHEENRLVTVTDTRMPVTDDDITDRLEFVHGRRFQRNVVARTRGLMERDGWFDPVPDVQGRTGRPTHAVLPSARLFELRRDLLAT